MKNILALLIVIVGLFGFLAFGAIQEAEAVYVRGYYRSNGTYVSPHYRSRPNAYRYDNYNYSWGSSSLYNRSYYSPTKDYSSSWYTPSYSDSDYWSGYYYNRLYDW